MWNGIDRRKFPRAEYPCLITVHKSTLPQQTILTHTQNISANGVRVIIKQKIKEVTRVDLEIDLKDTLPNVTAKGVIVWVKEVDASQKTKPLHYDTGIEFTFIKGEHRHRIERIVRHILQSFH